MLKDKIGRLSTATIKIAGITIVFLVVLELLGRAAIFVYPHKSTKPDIYQNQTWYDEYLKEEKDVERLEWYPYVYWRRAAYQGQYINIDANGIRSSWNPATGSTNPLKIFVFGGSTLWGVGARDEYTIPSFIAKKLYAEGYQNIRVTNFGENGYVNTQELITLLLELRQGNIPDLAIFYDGINDTFSFLQNGVAGIPQNEIDKKQLEFNPVKRAFFDFKNKFLNNLALYRIATRVATLIHPGPSDTFAHDPSSPTDLNQAHTVLDVYFKNKRIIDVLAKEFDFKTAFYWQPTIYTKAQLSDFEKKNLNVYGEETVDKNVYGLLKDRLRTENYPNFWDISNAFENVTGTVFIDPMHLSENGNSMIADLIIKNLPKLPKL